MSAKRKTAKGMFGLDTSTGDLKTALDCLLNGKETAQLFGIQPIEISTLTNTGVISRSGRTYRLGDVVIEYVRYLKSRTKKGGDQAISELEREKLQAQIDQIKLRNEAYVNGLKTAAYEEIRGELMREVSELKKELRKKPELLAAYGSCLDAVTARLDTLQPRAITVEAEPAESDEQ